MALSSSPLLWKNKGMAIKPHTNNISNILENKANDRIALHPALELWPWLSTTIARALIQASRICPWGTWSSGTNTVEDKPPLNLCTQKSNSWNWENSISTSNKSKEFFHTKSPNLMLPSQWRYKSTRNLLLPALWNHRQTLASLKPSFEEKQISGNNYLCLCPSVE